MNGVKVKLKEKEYIILKIVINMKVIGEIIIEKEKEFFIVKMVVNMKVIGEIIIKKEKELFYHPNGDRYEGDFRNDKR